MAVVRISNVESEVCWKKQGHWVLVTDLLLTEQIRTPLLPTKLGWAILIP